MRDLGRALVVTVCCSSMAACTGSSDTSGPPDSDATALSAQAPTDTDTRDAPTSASLPSSTAPTANTTPTSNTELDAVPPTRATTAVVPDREPVGIDVTTTIESIGIFGDSLVADLTAIGGRDNQVVPQITALLVDDEDLAVERVENLALPGQSVVSDLGILGPDEATIRPFVEQTLASRPDLVDLAVVAISSSDVNLNASLAEPLPTDILAETMISELLVVEERFRTADVEVVFLPVFGINDTVFSDLRCAMVPTCPPGPDAEIDAVNTALWESELPMLFERFERLDEDGDGRTDRRWFDDVDPRFPDDGVHPNADGQALYSSTVADALRRAVLGSDR